MSRSEFREADSTKAYGLPDLPQRAVPQLVNYGFRKQGNEASRCRINHLNRKITELYGAQNRLRPGHEKLSNEAKKVRKDSEQLRQESESEIRNIQDSSLRSLGKRILAQLGEATEALDRTVAQLDNAVRIQMRADHGDEAQRQDLRLRALVLKKRNMEKQLVDIKEDWGKLQTWHEPEPFLPFDIEEVLKRMPPKDESEALTNKIQESRIEIDDKRSAVEKNANMGATITAETMARSMIEELLQRLSAPEAIAVHQLDIPKTWYKDGLEKDASWRQRTLGEAKIVSDEYCKKLHERNTQLARERSQMEHRIKAFEITFTTIEIDNLRKSIIMLEKRISTSEERKDQDEFSEQNFVQEKRKAEEANEQELKEYDCHIQRKHALRKLQLEKSFRDIEHGESDDGTRLNGLSPDLDLLKKNSRDDRTLVMETFLRLRQDHDFWDTESSDPEASDNDRNKDEEARETAASVRHRFLELQGDLIKKTQVLENYIEMILEGLLGCRMISDLIRVFRIDMDLEQKWLQYLGPPRRLVSREDHKVTSGNHGNLLTDCRTFDDVKLYDRLENGQFRVLILIPAPTEYYPVICKMETWTAESLSAHEGASEKQYAALSYCWDSGIYSGRLYFVPPNHENSVKESEWGSTAKAATQVRIRNNLYRALLRLRQSGRNAQAVALWVDYLCINQTDLQEKTEQLPRMVSIYRRASNVCIWLGESDNDGRSDEAMQFISTIMDFASLDRLAKDPKQARKWYALSELMRDRWFSRRWVVQEIALAQHATVHCGGSKVQWSDFADAASLLISNQGIITSLFEDLSEWREGRKTMGDVATYGASILLEATNNLFRRKPDGDIKKPTKTIEYLATSLKTFDTGDPRDLIYSLVSIASDTAGDFWSTVSGSSAPNRGLDVHYRKPQVVVYKDFTKFCMDMSKSLDIICRPWAMPLTDVSSDSLPSWIPLLRNSEFGAPREVYQGRKNGDNLIGPAGYPNYQASGQLVCRANFKLENQLGTKSDSRGKTDGDGATEVLQKEPGLSVSDTKDVLVARGLIVAEITEVSPRNTGGVIHRESLMMGGWEGFRRDTHSVPDRIWRTLVADRDESGRVPPSWYQRACLRCLEIADTFNNGDLNVSELLMEKSEMLHKYLMRIRNVTWNRRFFTAECPGLPTSREGAGEGIRPQDAVGSLGEPITQNVESSENSEKKDDKELSPEKSETEDDDKITSREEPQVMPGAWVSEQVVLTTETPQNTGESERGVGETEQAGDHGNSVKQELKERQDAGPSSDSEPSSPREKLFGLCPPDTRNGDIVCVLFGCSVPVVMRRKQSTDHCVLIGEAYVHGKMDGEAVEDCDVTDDSSDTVEFHIL